MKNNNANDLIEGAKLASSIQPGFALLKSLAQSKSLIVMMIIGLVFFGGFAMFLIKMAS